VHTIGAERLVRDAVGEVETVTVRRIKGWDANWTDPGSPLIGSWLAAEHQLRGREVPMAVRLPASDASRWRREGVPALCYGPQPTWSAGVDDYAEEDEVIDCIGLYAMTALDYLRFTP